MRRLRLREHAAFTSHWRQLSRYAAAFALLSRSLTLPTLGGTLKRREMLSARLGDILAELYLLGAVLKRFEDEGRQETDRPIVDYVMAQGFGRIGAAFRACCATCRRAGPRCLFA